MKLIWKLEKALHMNFDKLAKLFVKLFCYTNLCVQFANYKFCILDRANCIHKDCDQCLKWLPTTKRSGAA